MDANQSLTVAHNKDGSSITVHSQGAHLTSWRNKDGEELLYTSPKAVYKKGVAIRGGVPLIFPQFSDMGPLPSHGFARVRTWAAKSVEDGKASFSLNVSLCELHGKKTSDTQPSSDVLELVYTILFSNEELQLQIEIINKGTKVDAEFAFAFHTYVSVTDIDKTLLNGVNRTKYIDNAAKRKGLCSCEMTWNFTKEVDRLYPNQKCAVMLLDLIKKRTIHISAHHLPDLVVWNPWTEKTLRLKDLPVDGYTKFVCVEHGVIEKKVKLSPQATWKAAQRIRVLPMRELSSKL